MPVALSELGGDLEQMLSYLSDRQPWLDAAQVLLNRAAFLDVSRAIGDILRERQLAAVNSAGVPPWLEALVAYWNRCESDVITFNYDALVETAAVQHGIRPWNAVYPVPVVRAAARTTAVIGGDPVQTFSLLKLHGSVTWHWSGVDSNPSDLIYDAGVRGGWSVDGLGSPFEPGLDQLVADKVPMIVPPTATKSSFYDNATLRSQWQLAAKALRAAEELVIIGYSLPESDAVVRSLMRTEFRGLRVVIVDVGSSVIARAQSLFGNRVVEDFCDRPDAVDSFVTFACR